MWPDDTKGKIQFYGEGKNVSNYYKYIPKHPPPVFLPGELLGQKGLVGYSPWGCKESGTTERPTPHFTLQSGQLTFPTIDPGTACLPPSPNLVPASRLSLAAPCLWSPP